ncbi:hypothetical protein QQF64_021813 [Cirrhinus molitorella]|uniref:Uncharacterized protein n=1 Tax=Cirrhinus molitorella TaxID=172907 RepID=A0ABR3L6D0_9TELE
MGWRPSGSAFPSPPFLLPQLLSNQPSLPPPPASLDTHTPSNTDLPPTCTPPNHFPPLLPLLERFNDLSFFLVHFPSLCLSADLSLASKRRMRGMH